MESEFPDPDEEFELMHAEEMEMLQEHDNFDDDDFFDGRSKAKRTLKFNSPPNSNTTKKTSSDSLQHNNLVSTDENTEISTGASESTINLSMNINSQDPVNTESLLNALEKSPVISSKRRIDDLFGNIDDIDFDDDHTVKKSKQDGLTKDERDELTIETILLERKRLLEEKMLPRLVNANARLFKSSKPVFSRTVPRWNFMALTDKKGERIYTRLYSEEEHEKEISAMSNQNHTGGLLSVPFDQLQKMAHEQLQSKWDRIEKREAQEKLQDVQILPAIEEELWVEKYKPKSYLELLSDEGTNRALLQWLKLWDKVVFNRERKVKFKPKEATKTFGGRFQKKTGPVVCEDLDEHGRPFHKIALLCGPPGLGKTTLAHMIANQAGYNVVEVNASDDRSPEVFRTQLEAATQMRAVMGSERRPNCLVLDEIDGAPAASIDVVLKFALGKHTAKRKGSKVKKDGGSEKTEILRRPIICICNDVYVPALRPLRQAAFVVYFPPTVPARLAQRLVEIARMQSMKADLGAMMTLSEKTNNDIRACLALLQCLKLQSNSVIKLSQIHKATIGQKDLQKGLFTVWQEIFQIPKPKRKTYFVDLVDRDTNSQGRQDLECSEMKTSTSTLKERVSSVLRTVQGCGDYDRLAQGVFENYLNMKIKDSSMISVADGLKWFCHFDAISSKIHTTQNYILYPYLAYPFVFWHLLFANMSWPKLNYPSTGYEMSTRLQRSLQVVDEVLKSMVPAVRAYTYREQLVLDTLPLLIEIVVPNLRSVSLSLYSRKEKEELQHVINVMIDYNLTYTQERTPDGNYIFNMDPNVEEVSRFDGGKGCRSMTYALRQLVSREVELEKLRRAEASLYRDSVPNNSGTSQTTATSAPNESSTPKRVEKKDFKNHLQKLTPKSITTPKDLQTKDFFGRVIENPLIPDQLKAGTDDIVKSDIWYHFKEGYNNAVRRNIYMTDLL